MDTMLKAVGIALAAVFTVLALKKDTPWAAAAGAMSAVIITGAAVTEAARIFGELSAAAAFSGADESIEVILRVLAITVTSRITSAICRDAGESAAAAGLELSGTVLAMAASVPLAVKIIRMFFPAGI